MRARQARVVRALLAVAACQRRDLSERDLRGFLDALDRAGTLDTAEEDPQRWADLDLRWCRLLALLLSNRGPDPIGYLSGISRYKHERLAGHRHNCGRQLFVVTLEITALADYSRELWYCERCGVVADIPAGLQPPTLQPTGTGLALVTSPWAEPWITSGIAPVGHHQEPSTAPERLQRLPLLFEAPARPAGHRLGVAMVADREHLFLHSTLPPLR
jgi:hypothetical protein